MFLQQIAVHEIPLLASSTPELVGPMVSSTSHAKRYVVNKDDQNRLRLVTRHVNYYFMALRAEGIRRSLQSATLDLFLDKLMRMHHVDYCHAGGL